MRRAQQLGRYHLLDRIAFGGMAEIFRAKTFDANGHAHLVAVKRVLAHLAEDEDFIQMLVDEAKIAGVLKHPNIARVYEFARAHGEYFIAMEHVDGKDLRSMLERCRQQRRPMPAQHAAYVTAEVAAALHAAHTATDAAGQPLRIVHRDVSPSNVICSYTGEVKLCDFGIAKATLSRVQTKTGVIKGKVKYMSPEQALGRKLDHRSDIFSLGSCLYEMLTRVPPFVASNEMDLLLKVRDAKYRPVRELAPEVPAELEAICDKTLTRSRANRYQTGDELAEALRSFLQRYMPDYSRSHLGRYVRQMFTNEIEQDLRQLEEFVVVQEEINDDVGENLIAQALGPKAEYEQFSPRPTQIRDPLEPLPGMRLDTPVDPPTGTADVFVDDLPPAPTSPPVRSRPTPARPGPSGRAASIAPEPRPARPGPPGRAPSIAPEPRRPEAAPRRASSIAPEPRGAKPDASSRSVPEPRTSRPGPPPADARAPRRPPLPRRETAAPQMPLPPAAPGRTAAPARVPLDALARASGIPDDHLRPPPAPVQDDGAFNLHEADTLILDGNRPAALRKRKAAAQADDDVHGLPTMIIDPSRPSSPRRRDDD